MPSPIDNFYLLQHNLRTPKYSPYVISYNEKDCAINTTCGLIEATSNGFIIDTKNNDIYWAATPLDIMKYLEGKVT